MSFIKEYIKKKILKTYEDLDISHLKQLKIIQKNLLNIKIDKDKKIDLSVKGLLYYNLIFPYFSKFYIFFYTLKFPLIFPLSLSHLLYLKKNNIKCVVSVSLIIFYLYILLISLKKTFFVIIFFFKLKKNPNLGKFTNVFFPNCNELTKIPYNLQRNHEYTFIESCLIELDLKPNNIYHSNVNIPDFTYKGRDYLNGFPVNSIPFSLKLFLIPFSIFYYTFSFFTLFYKWQNLYLIDQKIFKFFFEISSRRNISLNNPSITHVIYDFRDQLLRPYWTYFADKYNYKFYLINTASGFYGFKDELNKYPVDTMYHHLCNWENYYVDNSLFFEYLRKIIPTTKILRSKISPFHVNENISFDSSVVRVAIYDVVPATLFNRALLLPEDRYRVSSTCITFLTDIIQCLKNHNVLIYLKSKHNINSSNFPKDYIQFVNNLNYKNIVTLNPRCSPKFLSSNVNFSISSPFTTAAFYETINPKSFFYDPLKVILKDDRAKQNLCLISGINELKIHIDKILKELNYKF